MKHEVETLLARLLKDGEVTGDGAAELVRALDDAGTRSEVQIELFTEMLLREMLAPEGALKGSRERLLAKASVRGRQRPLPLAGERQRRSAALAAAAAVVIVAAAIGATCWLTRPHPYPGISGSGSLAVGLGVGAAREESSVALARGDRVVAGPGGARLTLGGYCELSLDEGTEVVVRGGPTEEVVQLNVGRMVSSVVPGQGRYSVVTPAGKLEVRGTEFVTAVEYRKGAEMNTRAVVSVAVLAGLVGFDFGGETGVLSAGANRVFAAEVGQEASADIQTQTKTGVVRKVDLEAKAIVVMVARELTFTITDKTVIREDETSRALSDIRVGDKVAVLYSFDVNRNRVASRVVITARGRDGEGEGVPRQ